MNKFLTIIICIIFSVCLLLGCKIYLDRETFKKDLYNQDIIDFVVESIKGNRSNESVELLDCNEDIKNTIKDYMNNTFYSEEEEVLIYSGMDFFYKNKEKLKEIQLSYGEEIYNLECPYYMTYGLIGPDSSQDEIDFSNLATSYLYFNEDKTNPYIIEKENNLYLRIKDLEYNGNDSVTVYYKGLEIIINKYDSAKMTKEERSKNSNYTSLTFFRVDEIDKNEKIYVYKNDGKEFNFYVDIYCTYKGGKIDSIKIVER